MKTAKTRQLSLLGRFFVKTCRKSVPFGLLCQKRWTMAGGLSPVKRPEHTKILNCYKAEGMFKIHCSRFGWRKRRTMSNREPSYNFENYLLILGGKCSVQMKLSTIRKKLSITRLIGQNFSSSALVSSDSTNRRNYKAAVKFKIMNYSVEK
uniref:Uncharacterized protein n=1 Tax=Romanomermis culicivorax TaxID=13658 RepID=A0A915ICF9_ROMCU